MQYTRYQIPEFDAGESTDDGAGHEEKDWFKGTIDKIEKRRDSTM